MNRGPIRGLLCALLIGAMLVIGLRPSASAFAGSTAAEMSVAPAAIVGTAPGARHQIDPAGALELLEEALALVVEDEDLVGEAIVLFVMSRAYHALSDYGEALALAERALALSSSVGE